MHGECMNIDTTDAIYSYAPPMRRADDLKDSVCDPLTSLINYAHVDRSSVTDREDTEC